MLSQQQHESHHLPLDMHENNGESISLGHLTCVWPLEKGVKISGDSTVITRWHSRRCWAAALVWGLRVPNLPPGGIWKVPMAASELP